MTVEEHTAIVKELNEELKKGARAEGKLRVLVTGILADSPSLLKIFPMTTASRWHLTTWPMSPDSTAQMCRR